MIRYHQYFNKVVLLVFFIGTLQHFAYCQYTIEGTVLDSKTNQPLAFVNIIVNDDVYTGTVTDIDGKFAYRSDKKISQLNFSYVGYESLIIDGERLSTNKPIEVKLTASPLTLEEVVVIAGENPANRIIRQVVKNKKINNPERLPFFKYASYNKIIYDFEGERDGVDSFLIQKNKFLEGGHVFMMESVTERKFVRPDNSEEKILGVKVSGFKNPSFAPLATDIQPFSFYDEIIPILDIKYLNPICKGTLKKYQFRIEDTLFQNRDTTFILSFRPLPKKNFEGLKGLLYINTHRYAVQNVIAEPDEKGFIDVKIQQKYNLVNNEQWFPQQLNFELKLQQVDPDTFGMVARGKSYITEVNLEEKIRKKELALESVKMDKMATKRDSIFWLQNRRELLTTQERTTYRVIDSLGKKIKLDEKLTLLGKLVRGRVPVKFIDIDIGQTLVFNDFEGLRLGTGLYSNEKFLDWLSFGGFFGYGLKDKRWKYGGRVVVDVNKKNEIQVGGGYQNTLLETGARQLNFLDESTINLRSYLASQIDAVKQTDLFISGRVLRYSQLKLSFNHADVNPLYDYTFRTAGQEGITDYTSTDFRVNLRFAFKEKLVESFNRRVSLGTKYPVLYVQYTRGLKDVYNGDFDFNKVEASIEDSFYAKNLGETRIKIRGGYVDRALPYGLLFTGEGAFEDNISILIDDYFQTVTLYEFLSDRYLHFFFSHHFGSLLFKSKKFKPHISLHQNIGWGDLSNPKNHESVDFKVMNKWFYESGIQFNNLIKLKIFNVAYFGLGAGAFYRYGPYQLDSFSDNLAFKVSFGFSTK